MALSADIRLSLLAPTFAAHPLKAQYLEMAEELIAPASAGGWSATTRPQAVALRAAHIMTLANDLAFAGGAAGGAVSSKREGDLSVSYASTSADKRDADLSQTVYGRQLMELASANMLNFGIAGGSSNCGAGSAVVMQCDW